MKKVIVFGKVEFLPEFYCKNYTNANGKKYCKSQCAICKKEHLKRLKK